eukprot:TRINITY_DN53977_c0_g1_i1.p1 TRINITY_DN53977_c0_g1~~TRINITY_DN53977_c0_g1_i1.p1  ORF type:complete len:715 (-),score=171.72 TRINITY_DN53977_c0_g1_i1:121-2265(-)
MEGYLDKRSDSILKGFQRRYFVRQGNELKYFLHKIDVQGQPRGVITLTEIQEVTAADVDKTDRRFDIKLIPSSKARADGVLQMRADSKIERDAWIDALFVWVSVRRFGSDPIAIPRRMYTGTLACIKYALEHGHKVEGLFRVPGNAYSINEIFQYVCLYGEEYFTRKLIRTTFTVFDVSSALKKLLREYPEPILTFELVDKFLKAKDKDTLKDLIEKLPKRNVQILAGVVAICVKLVDHKEKTSMSAQSLAVCLGPCMTPVRKDLAIVNFTPLFELFLLHSSELFEGAEVEDEETKQNLDSSRENSTLEDVKDTQTSQSELIRINGSEKRRSLSNISNSGGISNSASSNVSLRAAAFESNDQHFKNFVKKATTFDVVVSEEELLELENNRHGEPAEIRTKENRVVEEKRTSDSENITLFDVMDTTMDDFLLRYSSSRKHRALSRHSSAQPEPTKSKDPPKVTLAQLSAEPSPISCNSAPGTDAPSERVKTGDIANSLETIHSANNTPDKTSDSSVATVKHTKSKDDDSEDTKNGAEFFDSLGKFSQSLSIEDASTLMEISKKRGSLKSTKPLPQPPLMTKEEERRSASRAFKTGKAVFEEIAQRGTSASVSAGMPPPVSNATLGSGSYELPGRQLTLKQTNSGTQASGADGPRMLQQNRQIGSLLKEVRTKLRNKNYEAAMADLQYIQDMNTELEAQLTKVFGHTSSDGSSGTR